MKRKMVICMMMATLCLGSGMTANAASETMPDGTVFDAEYYARNNPDVVLALGSQPDTLYQHYVDCGKSEGRLGVPPYDTDTMGIEGHGKVVSAYDHWNYANSKAMIYKYEDGFTMIRSFSEVPYESGNVESQYIIPRTDFSDGLLDLDQNGIDDRDPWNACGYTDLNYNCFADGAPVREQMCPESEANMYHLCEHGVVNGFEICQQKECVEWRERLKG